MECQQLNVEITYMIKKILQFLYKISKIFCANLNDRIKLLKCAMQEFQFETQAKTFVSFFCAMKTIPKRCL